MVQDKNYIIHTKRLTKAYGNLRALDSLDLRVPFGGVGLLGPNGAGKSTLIKCLLGLVRTTTGQGQVLGYDINTLNSGLEIRQRIGYMPESDCLIPEAQAIELVKYMGELSGLEPMDAMQRAHEVLHYVGIGDERYRKIKTYSTGMKQKIKFAQAIVHDPILIFLDEPTNGMDPKGRQEMLDLIKDISTKHQKNIVFSSHLLPDVEYICEHVIIINNGRLLLQGKLEDLTRSFNHFEIRIRGDENKFESILNSMGLDFKKSGALYYINSDKELITQLYKVLDGTGIQLRHAVEAKRTLEDIFVANLSDIEGGPV